MSDETSFWNSVLGTRVAFATVVFVAGIICFWNLSSIGIWEPWEANDILVSSEYASRGEAPEKVKLSDSSWNWAVPTKNKQPVARSLLKTFLLSKTIGPLDSQTPSLGVLERGARGPFAICFFLMMVGLFFWIRSKFGTLAALITSIAFLTIPAIFIGTHNINSELMFIISSTTAICWLIDLKGCRGNQRWIFGLLFGISLTLAFLDLRLFGLYAILLVIAGAATVEAVADPTSRFGKFDVVAFVAAAIAILGSFFFFSFSHTADTRFAAHQLQWMAVLYPPIVFALGLFIGRKSWVTKTLFSGPGLLGAAMVTITAIAVGVAYQDANPMLLRDGEVIAKIPVFTYFLENKIFDSSIVTKHVTFDVWVRQIGFSLLPWAALAPLGFAYLARKGASFGSHIHRICLVWIVAMFFVTAVGSAYQHYFFAGYFPFVLGIGLAFSDREFWDELKSEPLSKFALGVFAIGIILMLGKDLERFPVRFVELYLSLRQKFELPDDFTYGSLYKPLKYVWLLTLGTFFFAWASFGLRFLKSLRSPKKSLFAVFKREDAFRDASAARQEIYESDSPISKVVRMLETPAHFGVVVSLVFAVSAFLWLQVFIPNVTQHVSQSGVFETYLTHAEEGETLYKYQLSSRENSVYIGDIETIKNNRDFYEKFDSEARFFAVIPRTKLPSLNMSVRQKYKRNLHVLDARSSRLLLVSNQLKDGESDKSYVADMILEEEPKPQFSAKKEIDGKSVYPVFDDQIEFLGYDLDSEERSGDKVVYKWGDNAEITYYFRVKKRIPSNQKIFLHVDYPGVRISGDGYPANGDFPTNYWLPGDIVKVSHTFEVESYSTPGEYSMHFGFFLGSRRMTVKPKKAHDGSNRVRMGKIKIKAGL